MGDTIRKLRRERELTMEDLAFAAGMDVSHLGAIERGTQRASGTLLARIARALGVPPASIDSER